MPPPNKYNHRFKHKKQSCPILASRKEERKQERLAKKEHNIQRNQSRSKRSEAAATVPAPEPPVIHKNKEKEAAPVKPNKKREEEMKKQRFRQVRQQLKDDDKVIRQLEKKLRLNRRKGRKAVPKSFYDEGLGDLLDFIDKRVDPDDDLKEEKSEPMDRRSGNDHEHDDDDEDDDDVNGDAAIPDQDSKEEASDEKAIGFDIDSDDGEEDDDDDDDGEQVGDEFEGVDEESAEVKEPVVHEMPTQELDPTLMRRIRGQLNRITTSNLPSISSFIENMYRDHSSYQVNESICRCIESLLVIEVTLSPLKLVTEMCLLVASLHENIGDEVGGHAIHHFVQSFKSTFDSEDCRMECKKVDNIVAILCNMYAVSLIDAGLFYEIIGEVVSCFDEKSIELLLFILTSVGFLMRKDSPERMKTLIRDIQTQANKSSGVSKRTEFMLETLTEIKNNNIIKVTSRASSVVSPMDREELKSVLKNCLKRSNRVTAIPATLKQALSSNRWWIKVGPGLIENQVHQESSDKKTAAKAEKYEFALESETEERLCRSLRLNTTPLRRSLFKAVISSSDYVEAADRLVALCKKNQCIEAANVLIQIAVHETKSFNHFYVHVLKRLASFDRQYKVSIFYAIKDRLSDVPSFSPAKKNTFVQLIFQLMREKVISLAVVKALDFASLTEPLVHFMKDLLSLVLAQDEEEMKQTFERIPKTDHMLMTSIRLFISCFMDEKSQSLSRDLVAARIKMQT